MTTRRKKETNKQYKINVCPKCSVKNPYLSKSPWRAVNTWIIYLVFQISGTTFPVFMDAFLRLPFPPKIQNIS